MNEPGEWYLNNETQTLYYVPEAGETAESCALRASSLERLLTVDGVSGLEFRNVRFTESDWNVPRVTEGGWRAEYDIDALQAALDVPGAVSVTNARDVSFVNCEFLSLGADGLKLEAGVRGARVENCVFREIAGTAVFAGGANVQPEDPDAVGDVTIRNNLIAGYGRKFYCAIGVHLTYCDGAEISNNEIRDGYYTAVSCGWSWGYGYHLTRDIRICGNLIYNIGQGWLSDMGGIYMLGMQPGTVLSGNVIHNVAADPGEGGYGGWGIYLDEGSSRMLIEKNLVFCCASQAYNIHYGEGNVFRNNIGALCAEGQVSFGSRPDEAHATSFWYDNIFLTDGAPVYVHMHGTDHFYENGNLLWDLNKGADLRFSASEEASLTLAQARAQGYLHNAAVADPGFADAAAFDFTLAEDSPAFALNFKAWDYACAGTLQGATLGFAEPGGQTAPADCAARAVATGSKTGRGGAAAWLMPLAAALGALIAGFWLLMALLRAPGREALAFGCLLFGLLAAWFTRRTFINWAPVPYALGSAALCAAVAALPLALKKRRRPVVSFIVRFAAVLAVFYGAVLTLNNGLRIGEPNVMAIVLAALAVYAAACSVVSQRKKGKEEHGEDDK